jgi:hypothetical protein
VKLNNLYSRPALIISVGYATLAICGAISMRGIREQSRATAVLIYGFPWSFLGFALPSGMPDWTFRCFLALVLLLNTMTLYGVAFSIIRMFKDDSK